jgi:hypothetical protein
METRDAIALTRFGLAIPSTSDLQSASVIATGSNRRPSFLESTNIDIVLAVSP